MCTSSAYNKYTGFVKEQLKSVGEIDYITFIPLNGWTEGWGRGGGGGGEGGK